MSDYCEFDRAAGPTVVREVIELINDLGACPDYCRYCTDDELGWNWQRGCPTTGLRLAPVWSGSA